MLIILFFALHFVVVIYFLLAEKNNKVNLDVYLRFLLLFLPFVGAIAVYNIDKDRKGKAGHSRLSFKDAIPWMAEDEFEDDEVTQFNNISKINNIVPFQEALILNNAGIKRELIIDVIFEYPDQFVLLLHQARLNEDVEVVHYATTILSELVAKYDSQLHALEEKIMDNPNNTELQMEYISFLKRYIESEIAEGFYGSTLKKHYIGHLQRLLNQGIVPEKEFCLELAKIHLENKDERVLSQLLNLLFQLFPNDEDIWMLKLEVIVSKKSSQELEDFLTEIKNKSVYFSAKNREVLAFFQQ